MNDSYDKDELHYVWWETYTVQEPNASRKSDTVLFLAHRMFVRCDNAVYGQNDTIWTVKQDKISDNSQTDNA